MPQRPKDDLVRLNLGSHDINGRFRRCRPAVKNCRKVNQQKGKGDTFVPPDLSSTLKKPWGPPELSTLLMPWERELLFSFDFERSSHVVHYESNPVSDMLGEANGHPVRMRPASPLPTSPLPLNIFNPETTRKTRRVERDQFLDIRINLFKDDEDDAPFRPLVTTTPITPITSIMTTDFEFSPVQPQEHSAPWAFTTPGTTPIITTTNFSFSPNPQVHSPPPEAFVTTLSVTTTTATTPITPTPSAPITPIITTKPPLRRSARIAAIKVKPNYKD